MTTQFHPTPELEQLKAHLYGRLAARQQERPGAGACIEDELCDYYAGLDELNPATANGKLYEVVQALSRIQDFMDRDHRDHPWALCESKDPAFLAWLNTPAPITTADRSATR